jgi:predicted nuclease of predicted toxin-antitoxin system
MLPGVLKKWKCRWNLHPDKEIFDWARMNDYVVFTHDLDFGVLLAINKTNCPSVIQIRAQDVTPKNLFDVIYSTLIKYKDYINQGALITIDERRARIRILPIR